MADLVTDNRFADPDRAFRRLIEARRGLSPEAAADAAADDAVSLDEDEQPASTATPSRAAARYTCASDKAAAMDWGAVDV
jgi:hypothetical protein